MDKGYILLSRGILESDVFASQKLLKIWVWCLCKANFKDRAVTHLRGNGEQIIKCKRGQFIFGRHKAEEELFIDGSTIYKSIKKLEKMNMIKIDSNKSFSVITICKYDSYQDNNNYKVTRDKQDDTHTIPTRYPESNTTNTLPNVKKDKNVINISFDVFWDLYDKKVDKLKCQEKWNKLTDVDRQNIIDYIPLYKKSQPEVKYRKNPITFFNNKSWNDEIVLNQSKQEEYVSYLTEEERKNY